MLNVAKILETMIGSAFQRSKVLAEPGWLRRGIRKGGGKGLNEEREKREY